MTGTADRRPWLILSQAEAEALYFAASRNVGRRSAVLERALRQVDLQIRWIENRPEPEGSYEPSVDAALERQARVY